MGDYANENRADRFITVFNDIAVKSFGVHSGPLKDIITSIGLIYDHTFNVVRLGATLFESPTKSRFIIFNDAPTFLIPSGDENLVESLTDIFEGILTEEQIREMLKSAGLIDPSGFIEP